ncbi:hypothetical protein BP5796_01268 [Coleophoma crateriformis]|uniref:Mid2 domain-containing protein n=1 Tax=Coleophoma crateriformis TaxID=565419 RepID=A0A3D8T001_9HELO|nr:hypothetical protein BP5796_01268 [Coleophoma crateriformis]
MFLSRDTLAHAALIASFIASSHALAQCYYPDGTAEPNHRPCNQTISGVSACCDPLDACSESGFCLGRSGWQYRGSCTDITWASWNCAKQFPACVMDPSSNKRYSGYTALWSCDPIGTPVANFCCGYGSGEPCCSSQFTMGTTGNAFKPGVDAAAQSISSAAIAAYTSTATGGSASSASTSSPSASATAATTATAAIAAYTSTATSGSESSASGCSASSASTSSPSASATVAKTATAAPKCDSDLGTKVGVGVGVPLGVLALGILSFLCLREKRHRSDPKQVDALMIDHVHDDNAGDGPGGYADQAQQPRFAQRGTYHSPKSPWSPAPTYEAPNHTAPQELPSRH